MLSLFNWTKSPDRSASNSHNNSNSLTTDPKSPHDNESTKKETPYYVTHNNSVDEKTIDKFSDFEKTFCESDMEKLKLIPEKLSVQEIICKYQD